MRYFYLGPDAAITRLNNGLILYVDPQDDQVSANIIAHGEWEIWIHRVVEKLATPGARIVEVGANVGYYTVIMARGVGEGGLVTSYEANPRLASLVRKSVNLNGFKSRVRVVPKAAADKNENLTFSISRAQSGAGHISVFDHNFTDDAEKLQVEAVRLDDQNLGRVDMIRLDAEGSEPLILRGAEAILDANHDIILCLEWDIVQMSSRVSVPDFAQWLTSKGFNFWRIAYDSSLIHVPADELTKIDHCDIVAARHDVEHYGNRTNT